MSDSTNDPHVPTSTTAFHQHAVELAVEAGADPARARERMAQLATTYDVELALAAEREQARIAESVRRLGLALDSVARRFAALRDGDGR